MTVIQSLIAFTAAASLLTITPGVDTAMVLRTVVAGGRRPAVFTVLGIAVGLLLWAALVSLGLGALLIAAPLAFTLLRFAGAAYLLWLGLRLIVRPRHGLAANEGGAPPLSSAAAMRRGFLTNLLNPKVGMFYISFLPQFIPAGVGPVGYSFLLAAIHIALGVLWFAVLIAASAPMSRVLQQSRVVTTLDRVTGTVFVAFGARLALSR